MCCKVREMSEHSLFVDAWIREAQEVSRLVEDIESKINNGHRLRDSAQSTLLEVGVKLDRLESLLHNPPSKPILYVRSRFLPFWVLLCSLLCCC